MVGKELFFVISAVLSVIGTNASGELRILHSPPSLKFEGSSPTVESELQEIYSASLGLSVDEHTEWDGLTIVDPFDSPEAIVEVYIDGIENLGYPDEQDDSNTKSYPMSVDKYEPETFESMVHRIKQRYHDRGNILINTNVREVGGLFGGIPTPKIQKQTLLHLKSTVEEDYHFLLELAAMKAIIQKIKSGAVTPDNAIDFYHFRVRSLHELSDFHGPTSMQTKEAKKLLRDALNDLTDAFVEAYSGNVVVTVVTTDLAHTRRAIRSVDPREGEWILGDDDSFYQPPQRNLDYLRAGEKNSNDKSNQVSEDYPVIFNIMLWFGVAFAFSLIAIVYVMIDMDPGRDSIIYRMTSAKMKKEN